MANKKEQEFVKVKSLAHLKELIEHKGEIRCLQCFVMLNGGGKSWKTITYSPQCDRHGNNKFEILNEIDETRQVLTEKNLFNEKFTNIGKAIENGSFIFAWC